MSRPLLRRAVVPASLALGLALGAAPAALAAGEAPSAEPTASADADTEALRAAMADVAESLAEDAERAAAVTPTDAMRADATFVLRPQDAAVVLRPEVSVTPLERRVQKERRTTVRLTADLLFEFGSAELTPSAADAVAALAADVPQDAAVAVDGHTDSVGDEARNDHLSRERAGAVAGVLAQVRPDLRLTVTGHGERQPVAENEVDGEDNPGGRALNRRVEVTYDAPGA
ncbi:OmpA family protein [Puerhibacterium sp. TATVAM-FAB25]|uniref:OmpA family protein n=1 Tax=Puerhibacterium sp. TATVAM-FAB25 TaxID=3093699 RepID=UPI00397B4921